MQTSVKVRRFTAKDVDGVYEVTHKCFDTTNLNKVYEQSTHDVWTSVYTRQFIMGLSKLRHLYVAELEGKIVGSGSVCIEEGMAYISAVYIDPEIQGKGIGRAIMQALEQDEYCTRTGKIFLNALLPARTFYEKLGYRTAEKIPTIFSDCGVDVIQLFKKLV